MSEPWYVTEQKRRANLRALLAEPYTLGTITVSLDGDSWSDDHNVPYCKGVCSQCGAVVVMASSYRGHMRSLALSIAYTWCKQRGHVQDYAALLKIDAPQYPEDDE